MKAKILGGAALAAATVSLALAGAAPAQAKGKHHAAKPAAEKSNCGGKNGCPGMNKTEDKAPAAEKAAEPAKSDAAKPDAAKPEGAKPAEAK